MSASRLRFESFELDLHTGELCKDGSRVHLQDQPARLLALLASRSGTLVTRDEIQHELWKDGEFVEFEHGINTAILRIRKALDDTSETPRIIQTLPRKGYKFIAPVNVIEPVLQPAPDPNTKKGPNEFVLPVSVNLSRSLFLLAQVPYVGSYLAAFYYLDELDAALGRTFGFIPVRYSLPAVLMLALIGFAVRIYLIGLVGWGHTDAGPRYRTLFPFVFVLDAFWAATPLLIHRVGHLLPWAGLILMAWLIFGQRTLMRSIEQGQQQGRPST